MGALAAAETFMEESKQEVSVEGKELILAPRGLHHPQTVSEVVTITVQEPLLLDEVDEHEAVEHERRIPLAVALSLDPFNEAKKGVVLALESFVEAFGDALNVERLAGSPGDECDVQQVLFSETEGNALQLLDQRVTMLRGGVNVLSRRGRCPEFAADPLPDLTTVLAVCIDDDVLVSAAPDLVLDLPTYGVAGEVFSAQRAVHVDDHPAFLSDRPELVVRGVHRNAELSRGVVVPAELIEDRRKVEVLQRCSQGRSSWGHESTFPLRREQPERANDLWLLLFLLFVDDAEAAILPE